MRIYRTLLAILFVSCLSQPARPDDGGLKAILQRLFEATGNYQLKLPAIRVVETQEHIASYSPEEQAIFIEQKAIHACQKLGPDAEAALAFLIGHELAHCYQKQSGGATSFMAHGWHADSSPRLEKNADIHGAFNAYLAGYEIREAIPRVIDILYEEYGLKGKALRGYPLYEERMKTARETQELVEGLMAAFEAANVLTLMGKHRAAGASYEYILDYYQGREIYNNFGLSLLLEALNFSAFRLEDWAYPIEMDAQSRLHREPLDQGAKSLSLEEQLLRARLLHEGRKAFEKALLQDPSYSPARLNLMLAFCMLEEYQKTIQLSPALAEPRLDGKYSLADWKERKQWILAIAYGASGNSLEKAADIFLFLSRSKNPYTARAARHNLQVLKGQDPGIAPATGCTWLQQENIQPPPPGTPGEWKEISLKNGFQLAYQPGRAGPPIRVWDKKSSLSITKAALSSVQCRALLQRRRERLLQTGDYFFNASCGLAICTKGTGRECEVFLLNALPE
ncbi:MAG: hypothetical protein KDD06_03395 [Phaeodactylibacter sp.]|nr:hypothetical protein [Phaeodactylibacter sp.]